MHLCRKQPPRLPCQRAHDCQITAPNAREDWHGPDERSLAFGCMHGWWYCRLDVPQRAQSNESQRSNTSSVSIPICCSAFALITAGYTCSFNFGFGFAAQNIVTFQPRFCVSTPFSQPSLRCCYDVVLPTSVVTNLRCCYDAVFQALASPVMQPNGSRNMSNV